MVQQQQPNHQGPPSKIDEWNFFNLSLTLSYLRGVDLSLSHGFHSESEIVNKIELGLS